MKRLSKSAWLRLAEGKRVKATYVRGFMTSARENVGVWHNRSKDYFRVLDDGRKSYGSSKQGLEIIDEKTARLVWDDGTVCCIYEIENIRGEL